jgi:hypothetical protein
MAINDQRLFRHGDEWWVAQVMSGHGVGSTPDARLSHEGIFFTSLTEEERDSKHAGLPAGRLNTISHASVGRLLEVAKEFGGRLDLSPKNAPDARELGGERVVDEEGLRWAVLERREYPVIGLEGNRVDRAIEAICLDDSAMRGVVPLLPDMDVPEAQLLELVVSLVRSRYDDFDVERYQDRR